MALSDDEIYQQVGRIVQRFGLMECFECAEAVKHWLKIQKIGGTHLKLVPLEAIRYRFIVSNRWKNGTEAISQNGVHYGIEVRGRVFDNLSIEGLSALLDLG
jgi:hypothetical protein